MNEFDGWAKEAYGDNVIDNTPRYQSLLYLTDLKMAYKAGAAAGYANGVAIMKERCAEVAEVQAKKWHLHHHDKIAAAIRGLEI